MKCQVCGTASANVEYTQVINGQKRTVHLCQDCMQTQGVGIDPALIQEATAHLKKALPPSAQATLEELASAVGPRCPKCNMSMAEFKKHNRFGCPNDYVVFESSVRPMLQKFHGATEHRGRISERAGLRLSRLKRVDALRTELEAAVKNEDFEKAAEIRDRLRCLDREGEDTHGAL